jgi:hypothetical protein
MHVRRPSRIVVYRFWKVGRESLCDRRWVSPFSIDVRVDFDSLFVFGPLYRRWGSWPFLIISSFYQALPSDRPDVLQSLLIFDFLSSLSFTVAICFGKD